MPKKTPGPKEKPRCITPYCDRPPHRIGYCVDCYQRWVQAYAQSAVLAFHRQSQDLGVDIGDG